jgi:hypothetical protein
MSTVQCFLVKETSWCLLYARRYSQGESKCPYNNFYHNAMVQIGYMPLVRTQKDGYEHVGVDVSCEVPPLDDRWPTKCDHCDYVFADTDYRQNFIEIMMVQVATEAEDVSNVHLPVIKTGDKVMEPVPYFDFGNKLVPATWWPRRDLPAGAMFRYPSSYRKMYWDNDTEDPLVVIVPNNAGSPTEWMIDSRCSNCTMPDDRTHRCWVRTGVPPLITVGKGGVTCAAGAGSIAAPGYHGMLENGVLREL